MIDREQMIEKSRPAIETVPAVAENTTLNYWHPLACWVNMGTALAGCFSRHSG